MNKRILFYTAFTLISLSSIYAAHTFDIEQQRNEVYFDTWLRLSIHCGLTSNTDVRECEQWARTALEDRGVILGFHRCIEGQSVLSETFAVCMQRYEIG